MAWGPVGGEREGRGDQWPGVQWVKGREGGISGLGSSGWWAYVGEFHPNGNIVHLGTVTIEKGHIF